MKHPHEQVLFSWILGVDARLICERYKKIKVQIKKRQEWSMAHNLIKYKKKHCPTSFLDY